MYTEICQASIDENGHARGGKAGDQTSREVFKRDWYEGPWHSCLRPKDEKLAKVSAEAAVWLADHNLVGYDQGQRNTLHVHLKLHGYDYKKLKMRCETDCSAYVTACALCGGAKELEYLINAPVTSNMVDIFVASGRYELLTDDCFLVDDKCLKVGDILVKQGHTVIVTALNKEEERR